MKTFSLVVISILMLEKKKNYFAAVWPGLAWSRDRVKSLFKQTVDSTRTHEKQPNKHFKTTTLMTKTTPNIAQTKKQINLQTKLH